MPEWQALGCCQLWVVNIYVYPCEYWVVHSTSPLDNKKVRQHLSIFNRRQAGAERAGTLQRTTALPARRAAHPPTPSTSPSSEQALRRIHAAADEAREEIAALVHAERVAIGQAIATASGDTEKRLRGATEQRIDLEMKRVEEAGNKLRRDLRRMIRMEVAKAGDSRAENSHPGVPIRARA
jgi:hypothetical protein